MGDQGGFNVTAALLDSMWLYFSGVVRPTRPLMAPLPRPTGDRRQGPAPAAQ